MNTKDDNLLYKLETLASYESSDIDDDDFEVMFMTEEGCDSSSTESIVDVAEKSVELIIKQRNQIGELLNGKLDCWHDYYEGDLALHEYLGMSWEEYSDWV